MMKKKVFVGVAVICTLTLLSCGGSRVIVAERPSAPYYQRPFAPAPNYIWIDGDWVVRNGRFVYQQGYWAAPRYNRRWETGRWDQHNHGWHWQRGYWHR